MYYWNFVSSFIIFDQVTAKKEPEVNRTEGLRESGHLISTAREKL